MALTRITSDGITDAAIVNADINASAAIAGTKISPNFGTQAVTTTGALSSFAATISGDNQDSLNFTGTSTNANRGIAFNSKTALSHSNDSALRINNNAEFSSVNIFAVDNATSAFTLNQGSNEYITVDTNNSSELITLGNTTTNPKTVILGGNVGIGTTSPSTRLHIEDTTPDLRIKSTNANLGQSDEVGRISIHTSDPTTPTGVGEVFRIKSFSANANGADYSTELTSRAGSGGGESAIRLGQGAVGAIAFRTNTSGDATERMRIDSSGRVLIGGTDATNPAGESDYQGLKIKGTKPYLVFHEDDRSGEAQHGYVAHTTGALFVAKMAGRIGFMTSSSGVPTEKMSLDSSGRLLLGTTTEGFSTADDLTIASSTDTGITIRSGTSNQGNIFFADGTSGNAEYRGIIQYTHGTGTSEHLRLFVNAAEKVRIDSDGLKLNGDTAAANALDDYEEGTFVATVVGGSSVTQTFDNTGRYTKIGNFVHVQGLAQFSGVGNGTTVFMSLPFNHVTSTALGGGLISFTNVAGLSSQSTLSLVGQSGQAKARVKNKSGDPTISGTQSNKAIYYHFTYQVA
jgi:hypothetical protein